MDSVAFDFPAEAAAFLDLAATADVVLESFRPGVVDRLGVGYDAVRARNPRIVYCSTTGFGQTGPRAEWAGHDLNYLGAGGYLHCSGVGSGLPGATVADSAGGGMHAVMAILAALVQRNTTGSGAYLDVSVADGVLALMALNVDEYLAIGVEPGPGHGLLTGRYACYDTYECGDGASVTVAAIEPRFWANLCRALKLDKWIEHQTDDAAQKQVRADMRAAFLTRDRDDWVADLGPADTCVGPVLSIPEVVEDEQFASRGAFIAAEGHDFRQVGHVLARERVMTGGSGVIGGMGGIGEVQYETTAEFPVERGYIWTTCASVENGNPLFWDDAVAAEVTDGPIAPPTMLSVWFRPHNWSPGRDEPALPLQVHFDLKDELGLPEAVMTDNTIVFHEPIRPGDVITSAQILRSVSNEKTTKLGTGRFWVIDVEYKNQDGVLVGVESYTGFGYRRDA